VRYLSFRNIHPHKTMIATNTASASQACVATGGTYSGIFPTGECVSTDKGTSMRGRPPLVAVEDPVDMPGAVGTSQLFVCAAVYEGLVFAAARSAAAIVQLWVVRVGRLLAGPIQHIEGCGQRLPGVVSGLVVVKEVRPVVLGYEESQ
jgi:hypothetical protein